MIVSSGWLERTRAERGDAFCKIMLEGSYVDRRGNIFILRDSLKKAERRPGLSETTKNFVGSIYNWIKSGLPIVKEDVYKKRLAICETCPNWDNSEILPKCTVCGCFIGKLKLASEKCPINKWGREDQAA